VVEKHRGFQPSSLDRFLFYDTGSEQDNKGLLQKQGLGVGDWGLGVGDWGAEPGVTSTFVHVATRRAPAASKIGPFRAARRSREAGDRQGADSDQPCGKNPLAHARGSESRGRCSIFMRHWVRHGAREGLLEDPAKRGTVRERIATNHAERIRSLTLAVLSAAFTTQSARDRA
jgi:hypothetical protein